jgi:BirA family biotin operon repressor/biotin-[acetyl-CoA-carboxylase] ligase
MTSTRQRALLAVLQDGQFHSGRALGTRLGLSRGAVWKLVRALEALGLEVHAVPGKGYRLPRGLELLEPDAVRSALEPHSRALLSELVLHLQIDSTNTWLLDAAGKGGASGLACLAECQRAGRGRRGRQWVSPPGDNLYLSVLWRFELDPASLGGLSLAMGVACLRALRDLGVTTVGLKWPNDLLWSERKLGGILIELSGQAGGYSAAVVGVGVNGRMPSGPGQDIDQPWVDLYSILRRPVQRNRLAGRLLHHLLLALDTFGRDALAPFLPEFSQSDLLQGKTVRVAQADRELIGIACGVDENGALRIAHEGRMQRVPSGEVSIRIAP